MSEKRKLTDSECEVLISEVQSRVCLWNDRHNYFKNSIITKKLWEEVGKVLNMSGDECKKKWKNMKDTYRKKVQTPPCKSGSAAPPPGKIWKFASLMEFTRDVIMPSPMIGNLESPSMREEAAKDAELQNFIEEDNVLQDSASSCTQEEERFSRPHRPVRNIRKREDLEKRMLQIEERKLQAILNMGGETEKGEDYHFLVSLLPFFSRLDDLEKLQLRNKMQLCVMEALREHEAKKNYTPSSYESSSNASSTFDQEVHQENNQQDLANNNITEVNEDSFQDLPLMEELILANNRLVSVHPAAFAHNKMLKRLSLHNCGFRQLPQEALLSLTQLTSLQLDQNDIEELPADTFTKCARLRNLRLDGNRLAAVPTEALGPLKALEALNLGNNLITSIPVGSFPEMPNLVILLLKGNSISTIDDDAFANLTSLRALELDMNLLTSLPSALTSLTGLKELSVSGNRIQYIPEGILQRFPGLVLLELRGNPLAAVEHRAFADLPRLKKLVLSDARELTVFPNLNGTSSLELLRLDRSNIDHVPPSLCRSCPRLKTLDLKLNKLSRIPELTSCKELRVLDLTSNNVVDLEGRPFRSLGLLHDLLLAHNAIRTLPADTFHGLHRLQVLDLEANMIEDIHPEVFLPFTQLEDLNLGNNVFPELPPTGLDRLLHVKTFNNPNLREFPQPEHFPRIQSLVLSYAYHCCAFLPLVPAESAPGQALHETVFFPTDSEFDLSLWNSSSLADIWPQLQNLSGKFGTQINELWDNFGSDFTYPGNMPSYVEEYFEEQDALGRSQGSELPPSKIKCLPLPGPFLPCQDLFDWWTLRCGVWIVFLLAMLGNGTVVFVLIFSRSKMDVPRFLVCNLAAADFFMGVYLGFLAVVDASTLGEFRMYAIPWQMSAGCQLAGFLGVLSSELSVYTLAVITLERNYAITHAMHLNKRLSLKHAGYIMACGWSFAIIMALLPLFGISEYRKFAVCLPFETTTGPASLAYVVFLMFVNGVAFLILMGCYLKMYCAIRGSQAWNSNDSRIAKRMALLVFTDFICWSPIAFFSLTAAFGLQLVTLEQAKVFTVFVLPLNSCCNPFLYAILTKQFKKDCVLICKAIEESRVTRGIGRCRHSSNFSNRQTPANTNSLVDRSSRENQVQQCACGAKLLPSDSQAKESRARTDPRRWLAAKARKLFPCRSRGRDARHRGRSDQYAYQIAEIQQKQHKRASSVSSSENFSSSRSDSWRQGHHHRCGIPLRLLEPKRRTSSWLIARKTSQDSNLSSSRNDSSGSATTASTGTWRMSRSSASSAAPAGPSEPVAMATRGRARPRLTRQAAVQDDVSDPPGSPSRLTVRFLATIPSAAETSVQVEDEASHTAVLHASPQRDGAVVLHHEASAGQHDPDNT